MNMKGQIDRQMMLFLEVVQPNNDISIYEISLEGCVKEK